MVFSLKVRSASVFFRQELCCPNKLCRIVGDDADKLRNCYLFVRGASNQISYNFKMNNNNWLSIGSGSVANEDQMRIRSEQKRGYQWLLCASDQELMMHKKQAIELIKSTSSSSSSSSSSPTLSDHLYYENSVSQPAVQMVHQPITVTSAGNYITNSVSQTIPSRRNLQEINFLDRFGNDPSIRSHTPRAVEVHNMFPKPIYSATIGNHMFGQNFTSRARNGDLTVPYYVNKMQNNLPSVGNSFNRGFYNTSAISGAYVQESGNFLQIGHTYINNYMNLFPARPYYNKAYQVTPFNGFMLNNPRNLSIGENSNNGSRVIANYNGSWNQSFGQLVMNSGYNVGRSNENIVNASTSRTAEAVDKNKEKKKNKKPANNNFPVNVKSLLLTGILDGVPVKYVSWSREKNLRGVVKELGYLCSCEECKFSKVVNSYEFEIHAGCKTKHPNNHIYFENGKSIHAVVQELQTTPRDKLFEAMENAIGSLINQTNFSKWKESYQAGNVLGGANK